MKKILIVEDEISLLKALRGKFLSVGYEVIEATDGAIGLQTALTDHPDLILLDIVMPVMDGMSMLQMLRKDAWGKSVPVIVLTNLTAAEKVEESLAGGVFDFLVKADWSLEDVAKKVEEKI